MHTIPDWLQIAFAEWITGRLYVDRRGNWSRVVDRRVVPYNRALKRAYPGNQDFDRAAQQWLELWALIPTARLPRDRQERRS